jgi:hypothetical protein
MMCKQGFRGYDQSLSSMIDKIIEQMDTLGICRRDCAGKNSICNLAVVTSKQLDLNSFASRRAGCQGSDTAGL